MMRAESGIDAIEPSHPFSILRSSCGISFLPFQTDTLFLKPMGPLSNFRRKATGADASSAPPAGPLGAPLAVVCRPAGREEISAGLRVVLGAHGHPADDAQVVDFMQFALRRGISLADVWLAERTADRSLAWAVLPIVSPGRTLLLLGPADPPHRRGGDTVAVAETLVGRVCAHFGGRGIQLAQVLLDPADEISRLLYESCGFGRVAELLYLQGAPRRKVTPPPLPPGFGWLTYSAETHDRFISAISQTYQHSLDCPALNGLRDMNDVLAGHKASGEFDPALWVLLCEHVPGAPGGAGGDACVAHGVLLLSKMPPGDSLELVYLGLTPAARGRGLGDLLVREAMATVAAQGASRLSLAVDSANGPALRLYYRHGLHRVASKLALMRVLAPPSHPAPPHAAPPLPAPHISPGLSTNGTHVR
jgi:ribosomal protein S18 acetylase RimI-like enzyme